MKNESDDIDAVRLWGPVPVGQARSVGALAAASSVLLRPTRAPTELIENLRFLIPTEVLPRTGDTPETLKARVSSSGFFQRIWVAWRGSAKHARYVELNTTTYPQPRRVQWAEAIEHQVDADGDRVVRCLVYPHYYTTDLLWILKCM